jgi:uncharacterized protein (TIGR03067 family)
MRATLLLVSIATLLVAAEARDDEVKKELKKFEGNWVMVSGEKEGEKIADEHVKQSKLTWKGKSVSLLTPHQSKETIQAECTLDPGKSPRQMDWVRSTEPGKGKKMQAIYEFMGEDQYRVCFAPPGKDRPTEFATKPGSGHMLHVWKRVKE